MKVSNLTVNGERERGDIFASHRLSCSLGLQLQMVSLYFYISRQRDVRPLSLAHDSTGIDMYTYERGCCASLKDVICPEEIGSLIINNFVQHLRVAYGHTHQQKKKEEGRNNNNNKKEMSTGRSVC